MTKEVIKMFGIELPEPVAGNSNAIIKLAQSLHIGRRKNKQWNKYWVDAYNAVLKQLKQ